MGWEWKENSAICRGMHSLGNAKTPYERPYIWKGKMRRHYRFTLTADVAHQGEE